jgi:predicted Na+-dependent transporter
VLQDFKRVLASPGRILDGLALQYAVMPPLALLTGRLLNISAPYTIG